jgi:drug/metabolite transporter (DMT)-like permease
MVLLDGDLRPAGRNPALLGYTAALTAVVIIATYPAVTRVSVTTTLSPADLMMLRFGVGGLAFAPYLIWKARAIPRRLWLVGLPLSFLHGWGMGGLVIFGLQFAPAAHSVALGPGAVSLWIALLGLMIYRIRVIPRVLLSVGAIVAGVMLILAASFGGLSTAGALAGDAMFIAASLMAAGYLLYVQEIRLAPLPGVALVSCYSGALVLPWYLLAAEPRLFAAPIEELALQFVFQGILMSVVFYLTVHFAVLRIGSQTMGILSALVPVLGLFASLAIARDPLTPLEWAAVAIISLGVAIGARPVQPVRPAL